MGSFVKKTACPECGSKDNLAHYSDGSYYCFGVSCDNKGGRSTKPSSFDKVEIRGLTNRKISKSTCEYFGYETGFEHGSPVEIANYKDDSGRTYLRKIRRHPKAFTQVGDTKRKGLYGQWLWKPSKKIPIIVTEGEIDALSVAEMQRCKYPVVSIRNGAASAENELTDSLEYLAQFKNVILMFDQDEAGKQAAEICATLFEPGFCKIAQLPLKDANEMLKAGRLEDLQRCIWSAKEYRPDGLISGKELSLDYLKTPMPMGEEIPYPRLSEMIRGLCKKRLHVLTAMTGSGKTTISKELAYFMLKNDKAKIGCIFMEEGVNESAWSYIAIDNNVPLFKLRENPLCIPDDSFNKSYENLINNDKVMFYDHFGAVDSGNLYSKLEYMAAGAKCDFIIIDNLSLTVSGLVSSEQGERKDIDVLMNKIRSLIQRTGVGVIMIVQLIKTAVNNTDDWENIDLHLLKGSGSIAQTSDTVIALERNTKKDNIRRIKVLKNRIGGLVGIADHLTYSQETGRLLIRKDKF